MWFVILSAILIITAFVLLWASTRDEWETRILGSLMILLIMPLVLFVIGYPAIRFTTGLMLDYSTGEREGYVTKFSQKGIFYKTWEGQIQIGTGEMAALQEPWLFSVPDDLALSVQSHLGDRVRVTYDEALLLPFRDGETSYLITNIELVTD